MYSTLLIMFFVLFSTVFCHELKYDGHVILTSITKLTASPRKATAMSDPIERRKLKRRLQREAKKAEFDDKITELARKAADYDQQMEEGIVSDAQINGTPLFLRRDSLLRRPSTSPPASCSWELNVSIPDTSPSHDANSEVSLISAKPKSQSTSKPFEEPESDFVEDDSSDEVEGYCYFSNGEEDSLPNTVGESALVVPENSLEGGLSNVSDKRGSSSSPDLQDKLVNWAFDHYVTHSALDDLLVILQEEGHPSLPKLAVTLMQTPHSISSKVRALGSGDFWYRGLLAAFKLHFKPSMVTNNNEIVIDFFIDGISPYNSPSKNVHLWPIAGRIISEESETTPFIIALWCGSTKEPDSVDEFLDPFADECVKLMQGFELNGVEYKLVVRNSIADAPCRAMEKKVNPHNSKVCCERCGARCFSVQNRMVFLVDCVCETRTDESFRQRSDPLYHKVGTPSPFEKFMKMVTQFPLEPLHLVDLGAMKRILKMLVQAKASKVYLKPLLREQIDASIAVLPPYIPSEFKRKTKSLKFWSSLKGKELKRFLKYDGILVMSLLEELRSPLQKGVYKCFLNLSLGIRILSDPDLCSTYVEDAKILLNQFVKSGVEVFGPHFNVYNIHHLTHLADDCKLHGTLDNFDAYRYESFLGQMERLLHAPGRPLPQIIARTMERENHGYTARKVNANKKPNFSKPHCKGPTDNLSGESYACYKTADFIIDASSLNDNCCLTKSRDVVIIENIVKDCDRVYFVGRSFQVKSPFFESPLDSTLLDIFKVQTLGAVSHWCLSDGYRKCFLLPLDLDEESLPRRYDKGCLAIPFTHRSEK